MATRDEQILSAWNEWEEITGVPGGALRACLVVAEPGAEAASGRRTPGRGQTTRQRYDQQAAAPHDHPGKGNGDSKVSSYADEKAE
jgi:hypothetical protein